MVPPSIIVIVAPLACLGRSGMPLTNECLCLHSSSPALAVGTWSGAHLPDLHAALIARLWQCLFFYARQAHNMHSCVCMPGPSLGPRGHTLGR